MLPGFLRLHATLLDTNHFTSLLVVIAGVAEMPYGLHGYDVRRALWRVLDLYYKKCDLKNTKACWRLVCVWSPT